MQTASSWLDIMRGHPIALLLALALGVLVAMLYRFRSATRDGDVPAEAPRRTEYTADAKRQAQSAARRRPAALPTAPSNAAAPLSPPPPHLPAGKTADSNTIAWPTKTTPPAADLPRRDYIPATTLLPGTASARANSAREYAIADPGRRRIRDRYIAARFAGTAKSGKDLEDTAQVIKAARLYFEENHDLRAVELLQLAIDQHPETEPLWLALLEVLFLLRNAERYVTVATQFLREHPKSAHWVEVMRLGEQLRSGHTLLKDAAPTATPTSWSDLPNWIQAPWDLSAEIASADFHALMQRQLDLRRRGLADSAIPQAA